MASTKRKTQAELEEECERLRERVHRLNERATTATIDLEQMAHVVSHDLQEPLRVIAGFAELLQVKFAEPLGSEGAEYIRLLVEAVSRQKNRLDDLLAYSRSGPRSDADWESMLEDFCLQEAFEDAMVALSRRVNESGVEIDRPASWPMVRGAPTLLGRVFQNLISNSIKYRRESSEQSWIRVCSRVDGKQVVTNVIDNGLGFDPKHSNRIFDLFSRLYTSEQFPGTGVGLAICRRIIDHHGGSIWAESSSTLR